jgi:hypothetical protein
MEGRITRIMLHFAVLPWHHPVHTELDPTPIDVGNGTAGPSATSQAGYLRYWGLVSVYQPKVGRVAGGRCVAELCQPS